MLRPGASSSSTTVAGIRAAHRTKVAEAPGSPAGILHATLYTSGATFVSLAQCGGKPEATIYTPEQYRQAVSASFVTGGLCETEIGSRMERFGNLAAVREDEHGAVRLPANWLGTHEEVP
jgi:hypothetical protein